MQGGEANGAGFWRRISLLSGRLRRLFYGVLYTSYVSRNMARRRGECRRCGACCRMGARCRHLAFDENGLAVCRVYDKRLSPNCRNFPIDEHDLADRDTVLPLTPCGYHFEGRPEER